MPPPSSPAKAVNDVKAGRTKFPAVAKALSALQAEMFPFKVEGDCLYGVNRTEKGWWLWVFNNRGITKFADAPASVDRSCDVDITVSSAHERISAARELLTGRIVRVAGGSFGHRVAAGDLAVFEIK